MYGNEKCITCMMFFSQIGYSCEKKGREEINSCLYMSKKRKHINGVKKDKGEDREEKWHTADQEETSRYEKDILFSSVEIWKLEIAEKLQNI